MRKPVGGQLGELGRLHEIRHLWWVILELDGEVQEGTSNGWPAKTYVVVRSTQMSDLDF